MNVRVNVCWPGRNCGKLLKIRCGMTTVVKYRLKDFVVMPNHVHVLVTPPGEHTLSDAVQEWKSVSAHHLNKALGRKGEFWQKEYFDHIVRSPEQLAKFRSYIHQTMSYRFVSRAMPLGKGGGDASSPTAVKDW